MACHDAARCSICHVSGSMRSSVVSDGRIGGFTLEGVGAGADDLGVLAFALFTVASYVDADVRRRTADVLSRLFAGSATPSTWQ